MQTSLPGFFIKQEIFRMIFFSGRIFSPDGFPLEAFSPDRPFGMEQGSNGKKIVFFMKK